MSDVAVVAIHRSQFPESVREDLLESLRSRKINHKFHYDSIKQTQKWLALHQVYSPSRTDPDCERIYDEAFAAATGQITADRVHVVGLGCGGGQKDSRLLTLLQKSGRETFYSPVDVSTAMVLTARAQATKVIPQDNCFPIVCDLAKTTDPRELFASRDSISAVRVITFFGMLPNFEQEMILAKLNSFLSPRDILLVSGNLAPGPDYAAGVRKILPLYDNPLTRDWLMTFLLDLGVESTDGDLRFSIEDNSDGSGLQRIVATFHFQRSKQLQVDAEKFKFHPGDSIRLFFSYRHTPALLKTLLAKYDFRVASGWTTKSQEEGVFLVAPVQS